MLLQPKFFKTVHKWHASRINFVVGSYCVKTQCVSINCMAILYSRVVEMDTKRGHVILRNPQRQGEPKEFTFDAIYDWK
jgi:hypothetical protein